MTNARHWGSKPIYRPRGIGSTVDVFQSGRTSICLLPHFERIIRFSNDFTDKPSGWLSTFTLLECVQARQCTSKHRTPFFRMFAKSMGGPV